jgi:hypothetical protein
VKNYHPDHLAGAGASIDSKQDELVRQRSLLLLLAVAAILLFWRLGAPSL